MGTGIYTPINRSNNTMSNSLYTNRTYVNNITNYNDLIERVENLEKQYEINKKKELVRVF